MRFVAVFEAVFLLATGILDAFVQIPMLDQLVFHSPMFWVALSIILFVVAPYAMRALKLKG